jgi:small subunit ribosomal protein S12e
VLLLPNLEEALLVGVARGLNETARALEKGQAQLAILADDCNQPDYKKLVEALCAENGTPLLSVPEAKQLGQWAGVSLSSPPTHASVHTRSHDKEF